MANLNTPFMIGDVEIPNRCVLAPMAGVTNWPSVPLPKKWALA